ncbi:hypothetical protein CBR_g27836 [Chara braunii]|uniref:CCHC-type domain-containing protein n=1 Tax=Chara braunii TaxID=69332 RepID=A0A388L8H1_CHABU|nr:hypothetical protein CBR_g27836 [Chara braunii]|eukprot:GBG78610.1 hypothetical protein CBR_g27836 [Chara braunii]
MEVVIPQEEEMGTGMRQEGGRGFGRGRIDWRNAICWHCGQKGHAIKFCHVRRNDEDEGLISTNYNRDMYNKFGYYLDPKTPGGTRKEALRRVEAGAPPAPPAMFRMWQEKEVRCDIKVEEVGENEEVEQGRKAGTIREEPIIVESDDKIEEDCWNKPRHAKIGEDCWREARQTMERMEDLVAKVGRYQQKLTEMCEKVEEWRGKESLVYLYDMGPGSQGGSGSLPGITISGTAPRSGMAYRPPSRTGRVPHAVRTRAKGPVSPEEPAKDVHEPSGEKKMVDVPEGEDDEDNRLRKEEDEKAETLRWVQDLQRLNAVTVRDAGGLPNDDALSEAYAGRAIISLIDLYSGYDQFLVYPSDRPMTAMHIPRGLIHMNVAPQGWTNAVAKVQRHMVRAMQPISPYITQPYIDDLAVKGPKEKDEQEVMPGIRRFVWDHVQDLCKVLDLLKEYNLTVSGPKSRHCMSGATILRYVCDERGRRPDTKKINKILEWPTPFETITELERIPGNKNRANGLSRVDWDKNSQGVIEDTPPVDGFLDSEGDVRLHINSWSLAVGNYVTPGRPVWLAPPGHVRRPNLVLKPYVEEDSWGMPDVDWMMDLALASKYQLHEDLLTIEDGALQVDKHEKVIGGVYLLANALLQEEVVRNTVQDQEEGDNVVHEREDDDFEEGEIKEAFRAEEYGVYLELGMRLSCEMRERDACARVLKMRSNFLVRDDHLFMRSKGMTPRRVVCGVARQIDVMAALHDGTAGGHRSTDTTYLKIHELYYWDGMRQMIDDYCKSCVPCQERSSLRPREPLHPRPNQWSNFLRVAFFVDNITVRRSTSYAPATLWYGRHATFPIESFLKTWRRQDLETNLTFEELLDLRARQTGAIEDKIEGAASRVADNRTKDKFRWDKMARVRKEPLKVGDIVLLYDSSLEKQWSRKLDKRWLGPYRVTRCGEHGAYQIEELNGTTWKDWVSGSRLKKFVARDEDFERKMEGLHPSPVGRDGQPIRFDSNNLGEFLWAYDRYADELDISGEQRMGSFLLYVRRHIRSFVRSIVAPAMNWGHCKKLLWNYYTPGRQASGRGSLEKRRREPEAAERGTFEQGISSGTQREDRRKEHRSHKHERAGGSGGPGVPPKPAQREVDCPMPDIEPDVPRKPHVQEQKEEPTAQEKELDRKERAAREQEIRVQLRMKNLAELHERMQQGKEPEVVEDKSGKGTCTQEEDLPLFSEVWVSLDKLMDVAGRSGGHHQEMGVKLVSTDLLNLRGMMKEGFAAARASDQKVGERLTKVAQKVYGQRVEWEREIENLKKELGRQSKEVEAVKADMEKVWAENEVVRQVNQTLNKVNDVLRVYLRAQQVSFKAKEAEWERRIQDLETKYARQTPTAVVDWTEVQGFEVREQPAEEAFICQKEEKKADQQEGEEIPLIDKEMLEPRGELAVRSSEVGGFEWRMPTGLTLGQEPAMPEERPPAEVVGAEEDPPTTQGEVVGQQEGHESVGQTMVETEPRVDLKERQDSAVPQDMPLVAGLRDTLGSWATGSGPEGRVGEQVMQAEDRATCPTSPEVPQQEVTSKISTVPSSIPL